MPETSPSCTNCGALSAGTFCPSCGQKSGDLHVSLLAFAEDALATLISFDNRIARTLIPLLRKPGLVSAETLDGKRARYVPPMRLYLIVSFGFFLTLRMVGGAITTSEGEVSAQGGRGVIHFDVTKPTSADDTARDPAEYPANQDAVAETSEPSQEASTDPAVADTASTATEPEPPTHPNDAPTVAPPPTPSDDDIEDNGPAEDQAVSEDSDASVGSFGRLIHRIVTAIEEDKERATEILLKRLAWSFFLLPPIAAVWLRLLYRKREKYYVPHLVVSLHLHSAVMLFLALSNLTEFLPGPDFLGAILVFWIPPYVVLSVHRIYKMRWWSTLWRIVLLWLLHSVALLIAFAGSLILTGLALS